jgi:acyl dehydratase
MGKAKMSEGTFTPELIEEMRSKIGLKLRTEDAVFNEEATRTAIRKFADGIGDPNPLWRDREYARKTRYGEIVAPPSWILSVLSAIQFGWRGIAGFHSGSEFFFYKPVLAGDKITPEERFTGFEGPKRSGFADLMVVDYFENLYFNQRGETVSKMVLWIIRTERKKAREKGKYQSISLPHPWKEEELKKIEEQVLREEIRGPNPRYWEDVQIGDDLPPLVKGPLGLTDMIAFFIGGGSPVKLEAHSVALQKYRGKPNWAFRDSQTSALEPIFAVHYNKSASNAMGLPYPYDVGTQRHCWQIQLLTHWMGDDGWLKRCRAEYRKFFFLSEVLRIKGVIKNKYIDEDGEHCVDIETSATNQRGEEVMPGNATVVLPSKEKKMWPLDRRL